MTVYTLTRTIPISKYKSTVESKKIENIECGQFAEQERREGVRGEYII